MVEYVNQLKPNFKKLKLKLKIKEWYNGSKRNNKQKLWKMAKNKKCFLGDSAHLSEVEK